MKRRTRTVVFAPCAFLETDEAEVLRAKLAAERRTACPEVFAAHPVLIGRGTISIAMPPGTWSWDFAMSSSALDRDGLTTMIEALKRTTGRHRFRRRDVVEFEGVVYFRRPALAALGRCRDVRASIFRAALGLLASLEQQPEQDGRQPNYTRAPGRRGRCWSPAEDAELQRTFANRRRLSSQEWQVLLEVRLGGQRNRRSVRQRVLRLARAP